MKKVVLVGLNELNFEYIKYYAAQGHLPTLNALLEENTLVETTSEDKYELLEPWIQWVTIHTGQDFDEHQVFRLGDIVENSHLTQLWEILEERGIKVAAVSPFNAENRLKKPSFFVPDPWTQTSASGGWLLKRVSAAVQQMVNDNAKSEGKISSLLSLMFGFVRFVPIGQWSKYFSLFSERALPGAKARILDNLLGDIFISLLSKRKPGFASLFLNSGAHIQHHYLFNSSAYQGDQVNPSWYCQAGHDPLLGILKDYDKIISRLKTSGYSLILATGLHQKPHHHLTYYWRLKDHAKFLNLVGIKEFEKAVPRMSRDFLVEFSDTEQASIAALKLEALRSTADKEKIYSVDNRGKSLFVELIYPHDIGADFSLKSADKVVLKSFKEYVAFVAIKNGEHDGTGYLLSNFDLEIDRPKIELKEVHQIILDSVLGKDSKA